MFCLPSLAVADDPMREPMRCLTSPSHGITEGPRPLRLTAPWRLTRSRLRTFLGSLVTTVYYCAISLDGYIAEADDSFDWLLNYQGTYEHQPLSLVRIVRGRGRVWDRARDPCAIVSARELALVRSSCDPEAPPARGRIAPNAAVYATERRWNRTIQPWGCHGLLVLKTVPLLAGTRRLCSLFESSTAEHAIVLRLLRDRLAPVGQEMSRMSGPYWRLGDSMPLHEPVVSPPVPAITRSRRARRSFQAISSKLSEKTTLALAPVLASRAARR